MEPCDRWTKLVEMCKFVAGLADAAKSPVEFRFLNNFPPVIVGRNDNKAGYNNFMQMLNSRPSGATPLCQQIRAIASEIVQITPQLRAAGQQAMIVIASDGEASDGSVVDAIRQLAQLPIFVTVRLCTKEEQVHEYWDQVVFQRVTHLSSLHFPSTIC